MIKGNPMKRYHMECQSTVDQSMIIRMFEYDVPIAFEDGEVEGNRLIVRFPHSAVIFLRHTRNTPRTMTIEMRTPGGNVSYDVPILRTQEYDLDTIFQKKLYMLLPFYIFVYERKLKEYEENEEKRQKLQQVFLEIRKRLEELAVQGQVSEYEKCTILDMSRKVIRSVTAKYQKVQKGIGDVMGGEVLEYEAKTILRQGIQQGMQKGLHDGRIEGQISAYVELIRDGVITLSEAAKRLQMSEEDLKNYL